MQAQLSPAIPGLTKNATPSGVRLPDLLQALKDTKPGSDDRARKLTSVADSWRDANRWYYGEAKVCEAMRFGAQYGWLDDKTGLWIGDTLDNGASDSVRLTVNVIKPVTDQAVAMLTQDGAILKAAAGQPGVAAAAAAETSRAFLDEAWRFHNLDDYYRDTAGAAFNTGTSFILLEWDKTLGPLQILGYRPAGAPPTLPDASAAVMPAGISADGALVPPGEMGAPPAADPALDAPSNSSAPTLPPPPEPVYGPQGDLRYRMLMRDQVAYDPASRRRGGQDGLGVAIRWNESRAKLMEIAPDKFPELPESSGTESSSPTNEEATQRVSAAPWSETLYGAKDKDADTLEVIVFYLRSRPDARRGNCIMVCAGKVLYEGENDIYPTSEEIERGELWPSENWPLFDFIADSRENCPWGRSRIVEAIPIQHAINGCFSKAMQHIALMANVKWVLPAGMDFEPDDTPGQVARIPLRFWQMTNGDPLKATQVQQMPPEYMTTAAILIQRLEAEVGVNAASMGASPTSDASGRLSQSLQQRDTTRIAPLKRSHDNQWARLQTYALRLFRRNATGKRLLRVVGEDQSVAVKFFNVADLAAGTEVYAVNDTSVPRDPKERIVYFNNLAQTLAALPAEEQQTLMLELARIPEIDEWLQRRSPHAVKAIRNNRLLLLNENDGTPADKTPPSWPPNTPIPAPWDNALIHKSELERFVCSAEYLDRVKQEKLAPENMGVSPLEMRSTALWMYWAQKAVEIAQAATPPAPVLAGPGSDKSAPAQKQAA